MDYDALVVYAGPTIDAKTIERILPGARLRPAICRGDLYRDRILGNQLFVVLDGVFCQQEAISPREVIDVSQDGAVAIGASSMGALRAAECWPAGMLGLGAIYRLFRFGRLHSDDEVAVVFDPSGTVRATVALINVRYAASRAHRTGLLSKREAGNLVEAAESLFFPDRTWRSILDGAGLSQRREELAAALGSFDLKKKDAVRALHSIARWRELGRDLGASARVSGAQFAPSELRRQLAVDALAGTTIVDIKPRLMSWLMLSGRVAAYLPAALAVSSAAIAQDSVEASGMLADLWENYGLFIQEDEDEWRDRWQQGSEQLAAQVAVKASWPMLLDANSKEVAKLTDAIWAEIAVQGNLDLEVLHLRAFEAACSTAQTRSIRPSGLHYHLAESQIATNFGFGTWQELEVIWQSKQSIWQKLVAFRGQLASAKAVRQVWFSGCQELSGGNGT